MSARAFRPEAARTIGGRDAQLALALLLAMGLGLAFLYSASQGFAGRLGRAAGYFATRQAAFMGLGALMAGALAFLRPEALRPAVKWIILGGLAAQFLPFLPLIGMEKNGARRWISLFGQSVQPSEFLKPALILYLAHILARKEEEGKSASLLSGFLPPLLVTGAAVLTVFAQNDLSTAVILGLAALSVFWAAGTPLAFLGGLAALGLPLAALSVLTSEFRLRRIITFLFPDFDSHGISYQMSASIRAVRSGGLLGKGIGLGTYKVSSIPEVQADFIFAAIAEEGGLVYVALVSGLLAFIACRSYRVSLRAGSAYRRYAAYGLASLFTLQCLVNLAVVAGAIPATGVILPFFSSGGSALLSAMIQAGLLLGLSRTDGQEAPRG
jgi:cell division protein FtsW